ncbi:hypothetical protein O159_21890 [Leifsonia xyli subsp. cynodontis DSM 46306]|uniref:Uncharacterized protein n=1 Tax=Leifsonia xyli subsp. cynodontis DSM 46306 TaxID=1389489 RepID=U3P9F9_LEIXC|nr:hypothetical protein O159_21890 [Leifsonia xyli subsp. cynodontis DSM 46306]
MWPAMDVTFRMLAWPVSRAPSRSSGSRAETTRLVPIILMSNIQIQSSTLEDSTESSPRAPPALLTRAWTPPVAARRSRRASTSSCRVRSAAKVSAPVSAASAASRSERRATPTTSQPRSRNRRTVAAPIPELAPVTTTRLLIRPIVPVTVCFGGVARAPP